MDAWKDFSSPSKARCVARPCQAPPRTRTPTGSFDCSGAPRSDRTRGGCSTDTEKISAIDTGGKSFPQWVRHSDAELNELIDRLLEAKRPRAAFEAVRLDWPRIETSRLKRLLVDAATVDAESANLYRLEAYRVSEALDSLDGRTGVTPDEMARLEFMHIEALDHSKHGIPNLERWIVESPVNFVQVLALRFKRRDNGQDPPEWWIEDPEQWAGAYSLLGQIGRTPGTGVGRQGRYRGALGLDNRDAAALCRIRPRENR